MDNKTHLNTMKNLSLFFSFILFLISSCGTEPDNDNLINPNILKVVDCCRDQLVSGNYFQGLFFDSTIIATGPLTVFQVDSSFEVIERDNIWMNIAAQFENPFGIGFYIGLNTTKDKLIFVKSLYGDVSVGGLYEYELESKQLVQIRDSSYNISTAVYWHGNDNKLVYYSYGNEIGMEAGYYLYDKTADSDSLLLAHRADIGSSEVINGFDLSADNSTLLYPNVRASLTNPDVPQTPQIVEYNLNTQQADTFATVFDMSFVRVGLWLRYSPSGDRILYCNFPLNSLSRVTNDDSEIGIIELPSRIKKILDVNTTEGNSMRSVQIAPTWGYDGQYIIYGSGELFMPSGSKGDYSLYLLKNVDDLQNYK
jgi:hypothetical protein